MRRVETQRQQQPAQQPVEEGSIPHAVHLQATTPLDGSLPGVTVKGASLLAWHPTRQRLLTASTAAVVEYDAISGARRNLVEVTGTPLHVSYTRDGSAVVLLTKERGIYCWSTASWKRRVLLSPDPKYAGKKLAAGLMAVSGGGQPMVYWTPLGKNTVRMVHTAVIDVPKGAKLDRELVPGVKLKTENKKPIVGLAAHPTERNVLFVLLADGTLQVCVVAGATVAAVFSLPIAGVNAAAERVAVHSWRHPIVPGGALLAVEAASSGVSILEALPRQEPRLMGALTFGAGSLICGVGLLSNGLLCAAGRLASGNVQVQAWELLGDSRELQVLPTVASPGMVWDALQGMVGKAALADVTGENAITRLHFHPPSGAIAVATGLRGREGEAAHHRVPLLQLVDGADVGGVPSSTPIHTGLGFWTARDSGDSMVGKLRFPRYGHVISANKVCHYDLTHGMLSDHLALPPANVAGQERQLVKAVRSAKQGAWLAFTKVLSRRREGAPMGPGQCEFSLVKDSEAALTTGQWMLPGADGTFVGGQDELAVVLSNSGRTLTVYETAKLNGGGTGAKPLYSAELKEGLVAAVYPGPLAHIPAPPTPPPAAAAGRQLSDSEDSDAEEDEEAAAARQEWEAAERRRLEPPRLVLLRTQSNQLCLAEVSPSAVTYSNKSRVLPVRASLLLRHGEAVVQVAWQSLMPAEGSFHTGSKGASTAAACCAALLTSQRLLLVNEKLGVVASAGIPSDMGLPASCLWMGPALLVSTTTGQVLQVCWDGKLVHLCSLLNDGAPGLLGALADRLLIATRASAAGRADVAGRGISVLQPLLLGWASLAQRHVLPGGAARVHLELRTLVASYDASHLGVAALERLAAAGFADVAAAVAARSDSPAITPAHKAVFQAAAGDWQPLLLLVLQEWEQSTYHPGPPPRSSPLYARMVALARSCQQYGRFRDARQLLEAAGAHGELLALCVFQGDFQGLQSVARQGGRDVEQLADQLMAVNENAFVHGSTDGSLYGGHPNTDDWKVTAVGAAAAAAAEGTGGTSGLPDNGGMDGEDEAGSEAGDDGTGLHPLEIEVAPAGRLPFQEASLQVLSAADPVPAPAPGSDSEGQPIESLDLGTLEAYVGVVGATVAKPAVSTPTAAAAGAAAAALGSAAGAGGAAPAVAGGPELSRMDTSISDISNPLEELPAGASKAPAAAGGDEGRDETAAQAAARAAFRRDTTQDDDDDFFSSDEESAPTDADSRSVASLSMSTSTATGSQRFRVAIRPVEEVTSGSQQRSSGDLRGAVQSLRLGALGSIAGSAESTPFSSARVAATPSASSGAAKLGLPPTPPGAAAGTASTPVKLSTSGSSEQVAAGGTAIAPAVSDPFADLFGLGTPSSSQQLASTPTPAAAPAASSGPMRPQPAQPAQQSNLLAGWDDFEALFAAGPKQPAAPQQQPAAAAGFGAVFPPPPPPAATAAAAIPPPAAPAGMRKSGSVTDLAPAGSKQFVADGLAAFQAGRWDVAATHFGRALDKAAGKEPAFAQQAVLLFVAARLLAAAVSAASKSPAKAARLTRFAIALPMEEQQRLAAVLYAVDANMAAKNYGYAADQLTWLIIQSTSGTGGLNAMELQDKLNACDRAGGSNAALPRDEDREDFAAIVGSCGQRSEAEELLSNIVNAS